MALIKFIDGTRKFIPPDKALALWDVFNGNVPPINQQQKAFVATVDRIYLGKHNMPNDYRVRYGIDGYKPTQTEIMDERYR